MSIDSVELGGTLTRGELAKELAAHLVSVVAPSGVDWLRPIYIDGNNALRVVEREALADDEAISVYLDKEEGLSQLLTVIDTVITDDTREAHPGIETLVDRALEDLSFSIIRAADKQGVSDGTGIVGSLIIRHLAKVRSGEVFQAGAGHDLPNGCVAITRATNTTQKPE